MINDFRLAFASLKGAKVRTFLTMFAIIIGVVGYMLATTFMDGVRSSLSTYIDDFGGRIVTVNSGNIVELDSQGNVVSADFLAGLFGQQTLTEKDFLDIQNLEGVDYATPQVIHSLNSTITRNDRQFEGVILMASNQYFDDFLGLEKEYGSFIDEDSLDDQVVMLGNGLANEMFGTGFGLGAQIEILQTKFRVIGVPKKLEGVTAGFGGVNLNRLALIPLEAYKNLINDDLDISEIDAHLSEEADLDQVAQQIEDIMSANHLGEKDYTVLKPGQLKSVTDLITQDIKNFSQILAYVMLFVGGLVITLIMLITVKERTREIGIRKSIGATNRNILDQFLVEALVISWLGSLLGVGIAALIGLYIANATDITPVYTLNSLVAIVIISTAIGTISGIVPAIIAARKDPVEALRNVV